MALAASLRRIFLVSASRRMRLLTPIIMLLVTPTGLQGKQHSDCSSSIPSAMILRSPFFSDVRFFSLVCPSFPPPTHLLLSVCPIVCTYPYQPVTASVTPEAAEVDPRYHLDTRSARCRRVAGKWAAVLQLRPAPTLEPRGGEMPIMDTN